MAGIELRVPIKAISKDNTRMMTRSGRIYTNTARLKVFNAAFAALVRQRLPRDFIPLTGDLRAEIIFHFVNKKHSDLLNLPKSAADICQGILYANDRQIVSAILRICYCGQEAVSIRLWQSEVNEGECIDPPKGGRT